MSYEDAALEQISIKETEFNRCFRME